MDERLRNLLHDEIDAEEDLREEATAVVASTRAAVEDIARGAESFDEILDEIAIRVEARLAEITTKAARGGLAAGRKRVQR